jgi:hypothetical protein
MTKQRKTDRPVLSPAIYYDSDKWGSALLPWVRMSAVLAMRDDTEVERILREMIDAKDGSFERFLDCCLDTEEDFRSTRTIPSG